MAQPHLNPALPGLPGWDITFTRLAQAMRSRVDACTLGLAHRFQAIGLGTEAQVRQTPRGLSTFVAVVGQRGLICIVELTLVDGMAIHQGPCAALDIRLLDACGDVVAEGMVAGEIGHRALETSAAQARMSENLDRAATAVFVAALGHFDLMRPAAPRV